MCCGETEKSSKVCLHLLAMLSSGCDDDDDDADTLSAVQMNGNDVQPFTGLCDLFVELLGNFLLTLKYSFVKQEQQQHHH